MFKKSLFLIIPFFLIACTPTPPPATQPPPTPEAESTTTPPTESPKQVHWQNMELKDLNTQETFKISDFKGSSVLIESFAVWCPTCTKQQKHIKDLHETNPEIISISLDTDPNENETKVLEHTEKNGFTWPYAISPPNYTQQLIDAYGVTVVNAPLVPVILVCPDESSRLLKNGLKTPEDLLFEINQGC